MGFLIRWSAGILLLSHHHPGSSSSKFLLETHFTFYNITNDFHLNHLFLIRCGGEIFWQVGKLFWQVGKLFWQAGEKT